MRDRKISPKKPISYQKTAQFYQKAPHPKLLAPPPLLQKNPIFTKKTCQKAPYIWAWGHFALPEAPHAWARAHFAPPKSHLYMGMETFCTAKKQFKDGHGDILHCDVGAKTVVILGWFCSTMDVNILNHRLKVWDTN